MQIFVNKCTNEAMTKAIDEKKKMVSHKPWNKKEFQSWYQTEKMVLTDLIKKKGGGTEK